MKRAMSLAAGLLLVPVPAAAQTAQPDAIAVEDLPEGEGRAQIDWRIDAGGSVRMERNICPQCAGLSIRRYAFTVDPAQYRRVAGLLPPGLVRAALNAPCALPHATYGWLRPVNLTIRTGNSEQHTGFVRECKSAELDGLRERLASATAIIIELAQASGQDGRRDE